ncbi:MAG TPA: hypothetical protein VH913_19755 [Hyphomicrobiaceae bacterium]|jgi:hypothetical protein
MKMKHVVTAGLGLFTLGLAAATVQAAPLAGPGSAAAPETRRASPVEKTHWYGDYYYGYYPRYRWWRHHYYKPYYGYDYPRHYYYRHHHHRRHHWY